MARSEGATPEKAFPSACRPRHLSSGRDCCAARFHSGRCPLWVIRVGLDRASASSDVRFAPKADIVSRRRRQCRGL